MIPDNFIKSIAAELKWLEKLVEYRVGVFHNPNLEFDLKLKYRNIQLNWFNSRSS